MKRLVLRRVAGLLSLGEKRAEAAATLHLRLKESSEPNTGDDSELTDGLSSRRYLLRVSNATAPPSYSKAAVWKKLRRRWKETLSAGVASTLRRMDVYSEVRKTTGQRAGTYCDALPA